MGHDQLQLPCIPPFCIGGQNQSRTDQPGDHGAGNCRALIGHDPDLADMAALLPAYFFKQPGICDRTQTPFASAIKKQVTDQQVEHTYCRSCQPYFDQKCGIEKAGLSCGPIPCLPCLTLSRHDSGMICLNACCIFHAVSGICQHASFLLCTAIRRRAISLPWLDTSRCSAVSLPWLDTFRCGAVSLPWLDAFRRGAVSLPCLDAFRRGAVSLPWPATFCCFSLLLESDII